MASNNFAAQPARGFSDRLQTYWDNPHPQGLVAMLKAALNGIGEAVQGSIAATSTPSTEQEAFWQNQGRDRGPVGALQAATLLTPLAPGVAAGRLAGPVVDALRNGLPSLSTAARVVDKLGVGESPRLPVGATRSSHTSSGADVRFVSRNSNFLRPAGKSAVFANEASTNPALTLPQGWSGLFGADIAPADSKWIGAAPPIGARRSPIGPVLLPPISLAAIANQKKAVATSPQTAPIALSGADGGGGNDQTGCEEERNEASNICRKAAANNWKSDYAVGPYKKPWTIEDCMRGLVSERCGGNPVDWSDQRKWSVKKQNGKKKAK